ncbi:hypothetical protein MBLNU230_g7827t1 [Neophaeotheca triangularis]
MKVAFALASAALATLAVAQDPDGFTRCGAPEPPVVLMNEDPEIDARDDSLHLENRQGKVQTTNVNTYVHIVTSPDREGAYTEEQVEQQMQKMNEAYASTGFSFNYISLDFTVEPGLDPSSGADFDELEIQLKEKLRQGTYADLNLYFFSRLRDGLLGFCYFPVPNPTSLERTLDGCVNAADSLPGGSFANYDLGATAVHETGHWLGIFHVFQGSSCSGGGDYVPDTPRQSTPSYACPTGKDSCPDRKGLDSIHNFMDYSFDACMDHFTPKQAKRMFHRYRAYRRGN